jgi:hypothetical protein
VTECSEDGQPRTRGLDDSHIVLLHLHGSWVNGLGYYAWKVLLSLMKILEKLDIANGDKILLSWRI